jgi:hypothetical protein
VSEFVFAATAATETPDFTLGPAPTAALGVWKAGTAFPPKLAAPNSAGTMAPPDPIYAPALLMPVTVIGSALMSLIKGEKPVTTGAALLATD